MIKKLVMIILFMMIFSISIYTCVAAPPLEPPQIPTPIGGVGTVSTTDDGNDTGNTGSDNNDSTSNQINDSDDTNSGDKNTEWIDVTCNNKVKDGYESDVDCGGYCVDCANGKSCVLGSDCESAYCNPSNICSVPSCNDGWVNGDENGIDCGGSCGKCNEGSSCTMNSDCKSDYCNPNQVCSNPSCDDGWKNGDETGLDCGGSCISCSGMVDDSKKDDNENTPTSATTIETEKPEDIEKDGEDKISLFLILFIIFSVLFIGLIGYYAIFRRDSLPFGLNKHLSLPIEHKKTETIQTTPSTSPPKTQQEHVPTGDIRHSRLKDYVSNYIQKGYPPDTLKQVLMKYNWQEQEIDDVLKEIKNGSGNFFQSEMGR